jgi:hypothetical protein
MGIALCLSLVSPAFAWPDPTILADRVGDAQIRRTDTGCIGAINPNTQRLPDIVEMRIGRFAPTAPQSDLFAGTWGPAGGFMRLDLVVSGLVSPPGPLGYGDSPLYQPFRYGPNPIYGWIEIDMDSNENTGGEVDAPALRYLSNVTRFGGLPQQPYIAGRCAIDFTGVYNKNFSVQPYTERSGEEFHVALQGEEIEQVHVLVESLNGNPSIFEAGETWIVEGRLFHRCHGAEQFTYQCADRQSVYKPETQMKYSHDAVADRTTISLVYPLTNAASALILGTSLEPMDGCDGNQNSIAEALDDDTWAATQASSVDRLDPKFVLLGGWQTENYNNYLNPNLWRITALVGTAYGVQPADGSRYIWTDVWPDVRRGDFNGDCKLDTADRTLLLNYINQHDGVPLFDDDGSPINHCLQTHYRCTYPSLYDTDDNGLICANDVLLGGDMDVSLSVNIADIPDFVQALVDPALYTSTHGGIEPLLRGDMNCDGVLNGADIQLFVTTLLSP